LRWAAPYIPVPPVIDCGIDDSGAWLRTGGLPGVSAVHPRWQATPAVAVAAIAVGLRTLHDSLPVASCPFDWSVASRLPLLHPAHRANLPDPPPIDRLVVCHGDACAPNTLIDDAGRYCGHVDFGELGVADRWPTWPWQRCRWAGTTPAGTGRRSSSPPTASSPTPCASTTTDACGKTRTSDAG